MSLSRTVTVVLALWAAGCTGAQPTRVRRPGEEYLAKIEIEGNKAIPSRALLEGLALDRNLKGQRAIDDYQLGEDTKRIIGAYHKLGYFSVEVAATVGRRGEAQTLTFTVTEGPRATTSVEILGLPPEISAEQARAQVKIADGAPFDYGRFDSAKGRLFELLQNAGYAHAQLEAGVLADKLNARATLRYAIDAGPRVTFGDIEVVGVDGTLAEAARERVTFQPGDPYSTSAVTATQQAISGIGRGAFFASARVDVDRSTEATVVPVKVSVIEQKKWQAELGVGAAIDPLNYQARLRGGLSHVGWPTPLTTLGITAKPAYTVLRDNCAFYDVFDCDYEPLVRLIGTATQQDLFHRDVVGDAEGGLDYLAYEAYTTTSARVQLGIASPLGWDKLQARLGWQFGVYRFDDISPAIDDATEERLHIHEPERLGAFTQTIALDYRDSKYFPRRGVYAELRVAEGTAFAGGAFEYVQLTPDLRGYLTLGRAVLSARGRLGAIVGKVPPTERYYAGGSASQRGFAERRLSPTASGVDTKGEPVTVTIGGAGLVETSMQAYAPFVRGGKVGGVVFLDGGDVTDAAGDLDLGSLHWALGVGLRLEYLPVGPIRIEVAYRLNRIGTGEPEAGDRFNYLLGVGEAF